MRAVAREAVGRLDIEKAIRDEAASERNLIPDGPGWDTLQSNSSDLTTWLAARLQHGYSPSLQSIINVRKIGFGIRPVPVLDPIDRIVYRALTDRVLHSVPVVLRDTKNYLKFLMAPVKAAHATDRELEPKPAAPRRFNFATYLGSKTYSHVVLSDIVAFYQYIDHGLLASELLNLSGEYELVDALLDLLGDTLGRAHGLPQLLDASDRLSEVYMQVLVRSMLRNGFPTWNFSDDLRILCRTYEDSRTAIEVLSDACGNLGLTINEEKTVTPRFTTYFMDIMGVVEDEELSEDAEPDPEANVSEYSEMFEDDQTAEAAEKVLSSARTVPPEDDSDDYISLLKPTRDNIRSIRRAVSRLTALKDPRGLDHVTRIFPFMASVTPTFVRYLEKLCSNTGNIKAVASAYDILTGSKLSPWQEQWLVYLARRTPLIKPRKAPKVGARVSWVKSVLNNKSTAPATRAEAALALSESGAVTRESLNTLLLTEPACLRNYYLAAAGHLYNRTKNPAELAELAALAGSQPFEKWLIGGA